MSSPLAIQGMLLVSMAIWGLNVTMVKELTDSFAPEHIAMMRMVVACVTLTVVWLVQRPAPVRLDRRQWAGITVCAFLMVYINQIFFTEGMLRTTATNGALIMALSPLVSAVVASIAFREALGPVRLFGVLLGFGGVAVIILGHAGSALSVMGMGDLLVVAAIVSFSTGGAVVQGITRRLDPLTMSWAIYSVGAVMLVLHTTLMGSPMDGAAMLSVGLWPWVLIVVSGSIATAIVNLIWNNAIARIGVARAAVFLYWVPVFGVVFAAVLLDERLGWHHLIGLVAVMAGTYLGTRSRIRV